jgi:hypothetical protein
MLPSYQMRKPKPFDRVPRSDSVRSRGTVCSTDPLYCRGFDISVRSILRAFHYLPTEIDFSASDLCLQDWNRSLIYYQMDVCQIKQRPEPSPFSLLGTSDAVLNAPAPAQ